MTARTTPPFRADHVGSFLRPRRLLEAREQHQRGELSAEQLRAVEDDAIVGSDAGDRVGQPGGELLLGAELLGDRFLGVVDDVKDQDAADVCPIGPIKLAGRAATSGRSVVLTPRRRLWGSCQLVHPYRPGF